MNGDDRTDTFNGLSPDLLLSAVEAGGFEPSGHVNALHCLENRVHDIRLEDGSHLVTKFYRPGRWSREAIAEEHALLTELREVEIPVAAPLRFEDGDTIHEAEGLYYGVWDRIGGRSPEELTDEQIGILGRLLARIHNVGASRENVHRLSLTGDSYGRDNVDYLEDNGFMPLEWARRFRSAVERIADIYDARSANVPFFRIHGDCHYGNLLNGPEGWSFVDFDDMLTGPAVQDVWLLLPGRDQIAVEQRKLFIEAYREFREFKESWLNLVEPLRALRFVRYAAWIAKRWKDPAFPRSFPHFNTHAYWAEETRDLEKILTQIQEESPTMFPQPDLRQGGEDDGDELGETGNLGPEDEDAQPTFIHHDGPNASDYLRGPVDDDIGNRIADDDPDRWN